MQEIVVRAGCFVAIIFIGYMLRRIGVFQEQDFKVLSKVVLKVTLPAAIIVSFAGREIDPSLLTLALLGLGGGIIYMGLGFLAFNREGRDQQGFAILNTSGYNIGNFTLPFVQSFLGPVGVIATGLFDIGNSMVCFGGAYSVASIVKTKETFSLMRILKALVRSVAFDTYVIMIVLCMLKLTVPSPIVSLAELIGNANAFMAMLMIGVGFKLAGDWKLIGKIVKVVLVRYGFAVVFAIACYMLLPFSLEIRQTLVILCFSPIASAAPAFTEELKSDVGLASAVNSISIVISIICIVSLLLIML